MTSVGSHTGQGRTHPHGLQPLLVWSNREVSAVPLRVMGFPCSVACGFGPTIAQHKQGPPWEIHLNPLGSDFY